MKDYNAEIKVYEEILKEYPNYGMQMGIDIEKYLERAKSHGQLRCDLPDLRVKRY